MAPQAAIPERPLWVPLQTSASVDCAQPTDGTTGAQGSSALAGGSVSGASSFFLSNNELLREMVGEPLISETDLICRAGLNMGYGALSLALVSVTGVALAQNSQWLEAEKGCFPEDQKLRSRTPPYKSDVHS